MDKCEKCLYKKNCQFLATHKRAIVEGLLTHIKILHLPVR